ncbi:hypothetical protein BaRGS_00017903 [Batillaria attramentaria]|uniref:Protein FAM227A n=1 Tax=Batillaria attramentaria TaxID=370345 RepID=A0ABD0KUI8_9CAEN
MADINRVGSSMDVCDEGLDEEPGVVQERKRALEAKRSAKSPFLIGTIEDVNQKISKLEQRLQTYTQLVVESRASEVPETEKLPTSARDRLRYQEREKENKDVCKFAGMYTLKSTFLPNLSERVKKISKISMAPGREKKKCYSLFMFIFLKVKIEKDAGKPKFVELHQFPGYDPVELTPLPGNTGASDILQIVVNASVNLDKKPTYQPEFERLFFSPMSQALLMDTFWYIFLEHFQSMPEAQQKLFNRVAHNYVKLMLFAKNPLFRDTFLKDYPSLMSQAVYAAFCHCFPDSFRQFGEDFKNSVMFLVFGWMAGIRPSPRSWETWNFAKLEPPNIRTRGDTTNKKKKPGLAFNFDYLDSLVSGRPSQYASSLSLNQSASKSSQGSNRGKHARQRKRVGSIRLHGSHSSPGPDKQSPSSSNDNTAITARLIDTVAEAQRNPLKSTARDSIDSHRSCGKLTARDGSDTQRTQQTRVTGKDGGVEGLSPIRELAAEEDNLEKKTSQFSISAMQDTSREKEKPVMKSHPACKGPKLLRAAFNTNGRSPLVAHFLRMRHLAADLNLVVRINRTQIESLPPYPFLCSLKLSVWHFTTLSLTTVTLDAPTYQDVIRESSKTIKAIEKQFQEMYAKNQREAAAFREEYVAKMRDYRQREAALLSSRVEVKRLSELIILEQKKGDSFSAGANQAMEEALMNQN